jgi:hypothetical protein
MTMMANPNRSALGILLDAMELMVARDVSEGRARESMQRALETAHATLTHVAGAIGLTAPTDQEKLKTAVSDFVARAAVAKAGDGVSTPRDQVNLFAVAREWFGEHPYEDDALNDEAVSYFESFQKMAPPVVGSANAVDAELATMLRNLLADQGLSETDLLTKGPEKIRAVLYQLRNDASAHRAKLGDSMEVATLKRKLIEAENTIGELRSGVVFLPVKPRAKKGRRR